MSGTMWSDTNGYLMCFSVSVITENAVISLAVPEVDGIPTNFAFLRSSGRDPGSMMSSNFNSGCS